MAGTSHVLINLSAQLKANQAKTKWHLFFKLSTLKPCHFELGKESVTSAGFPGQFVFVYLEERTYR